MKTIDETQLNELVHSLADALEECLGEESGYIDRIRINDLLSGLLMDLDVEIEDAD